MHLANQAAPHSAAMEPMNAVQSLDSLFIAGGFYATDALS